jgi:DNA-binding transcriptional ArsR family regulator
VLERGGLVRRRRDGREHFLSVDPYGLEEAARWIEGQRNLWAWRLGRLDDALKEQLQ